jgi:hypothetical protein
MLQLDISIIACIAPSGFFPHNFSQKGMFHIFLAFFIRSVIVAIWICYAGCARPVGILSINFPMITHKFQSVMNNITVLSTFFQSYSHSIGVFVTQRLETLDSIGLLRKNIVEKILWSSWVGICGNLCYFVS